MTRFAGIKLKKNYMFGIHLNFFETIVDVHPNETEQTKKNLTTTLRKKTVYFIYLQISSAAMTIDNTNEMYNNKLCGIYMAIYLNSSCQRCLLAHFFIRQMKVDTNGKRTSIILCGIYQIYSNETNCNFVICHALYI